MKLKGMTLYKGTFFLGAALAAGLLISRPDVLACDNHAGQNERGGEKKVLKVVAEHDGPVIGIRHPDVTATGNQAGFETGHVVKQDGIYHMFVNEMFRRPHRDLRIAYWTSSDAVHWKRQSTVVHSIPGSTSGKANEEVEVGGKKLGDGVAHDDQPQRFVKYN